MSLDDLRKTNAETQEKLAKMLTLIKEKTAELGEHSDDFKTFKEKSIKDFQDLVELNTKQQKEIELQTEKIKTLEEKYLSGLGNPNLQGLDAKELLEVSDTAQRINDAAYIYKVAMTQNAHKHEFLGKTFGALPKAQEFRKLLGKVRVDSKAMTSGDISDWVPTNLSPIFFEDVYLATDVWNIFTMLPIPKGSSFDLGFLLAGVSATYESAEATSATESNPTDQKKSLSGKKIMTYSNYSYEAVERAGYDLVKIITDQHILTHAESLDSAVMNGDTAGTMDSGLATKDVRKAFDGIRKTAGAGTASNLTATTSGFSLAYANSVAQETGKYGVTKGGKRNNNAWIFDVNSFYNGRVLSEVTTIDKYGQRATTLTGEIGSLLGSPIVVTDQLAQVDSDGVIDGTPSNNTYNQVIFVTRNQAYTGREGEVTIEMDKNIVNQTHQLVVSQKVDLAILRAAAFQCGIWK